MILAVLSTHAELASATAQGCSYCETGLLQLFYILKYLISSNSIGYVIQVINLFSSQDIWVWLWDDTEFSGGELVEVDAPLGKAPVFYKKGSQWVDVFRQIAAGE